MTTFTNLATGQVVGVVDGRDSAAVRAWLRTRPRWWHHRVAVVAMDPSAAFRSAVAPLLPKARVSVNHFYDDLLVMPTWGRRGPLSRGFVTAGRHRVAVG